ncbi:hypothetical protein B0T21DRAFT_64384 [Apiosordaria backusii]|uniref:Rhodopsin domain-containing protein n=1 Tax=Apiosordaria backusii TaxID=314023 RepID=A0AA40DWW6_9PEZI|nr:hypothetical protein B0T21DRAFT_64384 [Apiosordaria backusii]
MESFDFTAIDPAVSAADRGPSVVAVAVVGITVSTLAVAMRFWSRLVASTLVWWWDDWAMLGTLLFSHTFMGLMVYMTTVGLGKHWWVVPMEHLKPQIQSQRVGLVFYAATIWGIKISALLLYSRLFDKSSPRFGIVLKITAAVCTVWWIFLSIYPWTFCNPIAKNMDPMIDGECWENIPWYYASAFINAGLDLWVLLLPMPIIWRLRMSAKKKIGVTGVFLFGYCSAFLSLARFIIIAIKPSILNVAPPADPGWDLVPLLYLSMLEGPFAIIALCGPAIHQLTARAINHRSLASLFTSRGRGTGKKSSGNNSGPSGGSSGFSGNNLKTWPILATTASTSSVTAINENWNHNYQKQSSENDWQNGPEPQFITMANLDPDPRSGSREKSGQMV